MKQAPYSEFENEKLILRDQLAIDRTLLANERTLLAYLRAGVSLIIAGISMMHFSTQLWFLYVGAACVPLGLGSSIVGIQRFRKQHKSIDKIKKHSCRGIDETSNNAGLRGET
jgi:putative membrane protein